MSQKAVYLVIVLLLLLLTGAASAAEETTSASFNASPTTGPAPRTVHFTDTSTHDPTAWSWDFGDGATSTAQNPSHTYTAAGTYTVSLTATNAYGSDTVSASYTFADGTRPKASATIATVDESGYDLLMASIGGDQQLNETTEGVDWLGIKAAAEAPYTATTGALFFAIIFSLPFIMQWLRQGNMAIPSVVGIILGGIMLMKAPAEYHLAAVAFIALAVLGVVWGVIKDRV